MKILVAGALLMLGTGVTATASLAEPPRLTLTQTTAGAAAPEESGLLRGLRFGRYDLAFAVGAAALVGVTMANDGEIADQVIGGNKPPEWVEYFGNPKYLASAAVLAWGTGKLTHQDGLTAATTRAAIAVVAAGTVTWAAKKACGRARPREMPDDPYHFDPFSDLESFPSGHTTLAFAAATAIDRETESVWVPIIGYPIAALVGWTRMVDNEHWASDVVAGAAVGTWVATKAEDVLRAHGVGGPVHVAWAPEPGGARASIDLRF